MGQFKKFDPEVIRIRLNPEQAVLTCSCYHSGTTAQQFFVNTPPTGIVCLDKSEAVAEVMMIVPSESSS